MLASQTCMVYIPGHNRLEEGDHLCSFMAELKEVRTGEGFQILVQINPPQDGEVIRYQILEGQAHEVQTLREPQVGSAESLGGFFRWCQKRYPAKWYFLTIWNHGSPWNLREFQFEPLYRIPFPYEMVARAVFFSTAKTILTQRELVEAVYADRHASLRDFLDFMELKRALEGLETPPEILSLDGCLVNLLEGVYQIRDSVRLVIGSQNIEWKSPWVQGNMFEVMSNQPDLPPEDLARAWMKLYVEVQGHAPIRGTEPNKALSILDLSHLLSVIESVDQLARTLKTGLSTVYGFLSGIRKEVQGFSNPNYVDLYDLAILLRDAKGPTDLTKRSEKLLACLDLLILEAFKTKDVSRAQGVSIFFPENKRVLTPPYQKLDFALAGPNWIEFLRSYLEFVPTQDIKRAGIS